MEQRTDAELVRDAIQGHSEAFDELVRRHLSSVFRYIRRMVSMQETAEDLAQDSFLKAWKHLRRFDPERSFRTWVLSIARNTTIDHLRKARPKTFTELERGEEPEAIAESVPDESPLVVEVLEREEQNTRVREVLEGLSPKVRSVVLLHLEEGLTFREIAEGSGESINTIKTRYRRALQALEPLLISEENSSIKQNTEKIEPK